MSSYLECARVLTPAQKRRSSERTIWVLFTLGITDTSPGGTHFEFDQFGTLPEQH